MLAAGTDGGSVRVGVSLDAIKDIARGTIAALAVAVAKAAEVGTSSAIPLGWHRVFSCLG